MDLTAALTTNITVRILAEVSVSASTADLGDLHLAIRVLAGEQGPRHSVATALVVDNAARPEFTDRQKPRAGQEFVSLGCRRAARRNAETGKRGKLYPGRKPSD